MTFLVCLSLSAQEIQYRESESKYQQKDIDYSQGGILFRFDHEKFQRIDSENKFENKFEDFWRCKELWIAKNVRSEKVKDFIENKLTGIKDLEKVVGDYKANVKIDTTASWTQKDIVKKLLELDKRVEKLEKP